MSILKTSTLQCLLKEMVPYFSLSVFETVSLCNLGCSRTHNLPISVSQPLGLQFYNFSKQFFNKVNSLLIQIQPHYSIKNKTVCNNSKHIKQNTFSSWEGFLLSPSTSLSNLHSMNLRRCRGSALTIY